MKRHVTSINGEDIVYYHKHAFQNSYFKAHSHNEYELIFFVQGDVNYTVENKKFALNKYDLIITRPTVYHNITFNKKCDYDRYVFLLPSTGFFAEILNSLPSDTNVVNCAEDSVIIENFKKLDFYEENYTEEEFKTLMLSLLTEICYKLKYKNNSSLASYKPLPDIIKNAIEYINTNLFTIKDVLEISNALFVSKNYFFRVFKEELKIPPKKYIVNKRLLRAQIMLKSGEKPTTVYLDCGFDNYTSFYKQYVKRFGYSPSEEKKNHEI